MNLDRKSRDRYAEVLRHFAAGRLTNYEYEYACEAYRASPDLALRELWWGMWPVYSDLREYRLTGKYRLLPEGRTTVARMVMFLHTDLPYEWPVSAGLLGCLLNVLTLGFWGRIYGSSGGSCDRDVWPFFRAEDLARAIARPRLLGGTR